MKQFLITLAEVALIVIGLETALTLAEFGKHREPGGIWKW
jgi:hypothetical protein